MKEIQDIIFKYALDYPALIPFVLFGFFYAKSANFRADVNKLLKRFIIVSFSSRILAHDLFFQKSWFLEQIKRVRFTDRHKTVLFQVLLEEKVKAVCGVSYNELKANYKTLKNAHPYTLVAELLLLVDKIIETYEKAIKERYISIYGEYTGARLYKYVYEELFRPFHKENVQCIEKKINRMPLISSKGFDDIIKTFLTKLQDATDDAISDCEEAFNSVNGKIAEMAEGKNN